MHITDKAMFLVTSQPKINYERNKLSLNNVHMEDQKGFFFNVVLDLVQLKQELVGFLALLHAC